MEAKTEILTADLKILNRECDLLEKRLNMAEQELRIRKLADDFNTLTDMDREAFIRELMPGKVNDLFAYFKSDPTKQEELCKAVDLKNIRPPDYPELRIYVDAEHFKQLKTDKERAQYLENIEDIKGQGDIHYLQRLEYAMKNVDSNYKASSIIEIEKVGTFINEMNEKIYLGRIKNLYLHLDGNDMQKTLCKSIPLKNLKRLIDELDVNQSEVARSVYKGKSI